MRISTLFLTISFLSFLTICINARNRTDISQIQNTYINLLKLTISGVAYAEYDRAVATAPNLMWDPSKGVLGLTGSNEAFNAHQRHHGLDWPLIGLSMAGQVRLDNVEYMIKMIINEKVPGDFIECGVWRGGSSILARGILDIMGETHRTVFVIDSFQGLPQAVTAKDGTGWDKLNYVSVSLEAVRNNFRNFGLLQENVKFVQGFFVDSLPKARGLFNDLSIIRADGDMYSSTMDILFNLYGRLSIGGFVMFDDAPTIRECQSALDDFRSWHGITEPMTLVDPGYPGVYWRKERHVELKPQQYYAGASKLLAHVFPLEHVK